MSFATQKPPLAASQMALIRQLSFAAKTRSQIVWDRDLVVSVGGNLAVNYANCQCVVNMQIFDMQIVNLQLCFIGNLSMQSALSSSSTSKSIWYFQSSISLNVLYLLSSKSYQNEHFHLLYNIFKPPCWKCWFSILPRRCTLTGLLLVLCRNIVFIFQFGYWKYCYCLRLM